MAKYLAKYTVWANMFDGGAWMPDPEPHKPEFSFKAETDVEAKKLAEEHMGTFREHYFGPRATLDSLLKVEQIELKK